MLFRSLIAHQDDRRALLNSLQQKGVLEICDVPDYEGFERLETSVQVAGFERNAATLAQALSVIDDYGKKNKGMLSSLSGRRCVTMEEFRQTIAGRAQIQDDAQNILAMGKQIAECRTEVSRINTVLATLEPWLAFDLPLSFPGTRSAKLFTGSLPAYYTKESLMDAIRGADEQMCAFDMEILSASKEQTCVCVLCYRPDADALEQVLRSLGFAQWTAPAQTPPQEQADALTTRRDRLLKSADTMAALIAQLAEERREAIEMLEDYYLLQADKYKAGAHMSHTRHVALLSGYIPERDVGSVMESLEKKFDIAYAIEDAGEDAPVAVHNNAFVEPAESITEMYAMPDRHDVDPNPVMAFFYYLFFGMMLSDAGYGILITVGAFLAIKLFHPEPKMKRNLKLFMYCGISTVFWGIMFGGFFGDIVNVIGQKLGYDVALTPVLLNPVKDPIPLLILSVALGIIHIFVGMGVRFYMYCRDGDVPGAFFDVGTWYLILSGAIVLALGMVTGISVLGTIGTVMAIVGAVGLVLTQGRHKKGIGKVFGGIASLYDITGYISDIMSYSRLMALGLATGVIASVVNLLGAMVPLPFFILIFIAGHAINLGINALGAYVHTIRLQYVEFFAKFYEGGGRPFEPFSVNTKYIRFKEEN